MANATVLAIETTGAACSAALWHGDAPVAVRRRALEHGHAVVLVPMMRETMAAAGIRFTDLGAVAVCVGPGSFTGVRVGLATARAVALAAGIPARGVTAFEAVAASMPSDSYRGRSLVTVLDSRRQDLFVQCFGAGGRASGAPVCLAPSALSAWLPAGPLALAGSAVVRARDALIEAGRDVLVPCGGQGPDAVGVATAAVAQRAAGIEASARPLYLHAPSARLPDAVP